MENFVTVFDKKFLPQGIALHASMVRNIPTFILWILCMDEETYHALEKLNLRNVSLLRLGDHETAELLRVKLDRTAGEYCWTLTPFLPRFVFKMNPSISHVTYLDADVWFRNSPLPIFEEFQKSKKQILITSHGYAPEYDQTERSGKFCVQFIIFKNTPEAETVRNAWEHQCIDWCYARCEDGKFGDQKYLDSWPVKFVEYVHILSRLEFTLAPWNSIRFPYGESIIYHFQGFRIKSKSKYALGHYAIPNATFEGVYKPYFQDIKTAFSLMEQINFQIYPQTLDFKISQIQKFKKYMLDLISFSWRYSPRTSGEF